MVLLCIEEIRFLLRVRSTLACFFRTVRAPEHETSPNFSECFLFLTLSTEIIHLYISQGMAWHAAPFVRPLLEARKSDLVDFLHQRGQGWREDGSNQVAKYARNRVR